jgi:hypothetical protein
MVVVKTLCSFQGSVDIRRFTLLEKGNFDQLKEKIEEVYAYVDRYTLENCTLIRWTDNDGDNITIANNDDWLEAVRFADEDWFQCVRVLVDLLPHQYPQATPRLGEEEPSSVTGGQNEPECQCQTSEYSIAATESTPAEAARDSRTVTPDPDDFEERFQHGQSVVSAMLTKRMHEGRAPWSPSNPKAPCGMDPARFSAARSSMSSFLARRLQKRVRFAEKPLMGLGASRLEEAKNTLSNMLLRRLGQSPQESREKRMEQVAKDCSGSQTSLQQACAALECLARCHNSKHTSRTIARMAEVKATCALHQTWQAGSWAASRGLQTRKVLAIALNSRH